MNWQVDVTQIKIQPDISNALHLIVVNAFIKKFTDRKLLKTKFMSTAIICCNVLSFLRYIKT